MYRIKFKRYYYNSLNKEYTKENADKFETREEAEEIKEKLISILDDLKNEKFLKKLRKGFSIEEVE